MKKLESTLNQLAIAFASDLVAAVRHASLEDVRAEFGAFRSRTSTATSSGGTTAAIVSLLEKRRAGMRATEIRQELGLSQKQIASLVIEGLRAKKIVKTGVRRGTMYFAR